MKKDTTLNLTPVFSHKLADLFFDEENGFYLERWKSQPSVTNEEYIEYQEKKMSITRDFKLTRFLCDITDHDIEFDDELKKYVDNVVNKFWETTSLKKFAFVSSENYATRMSLSAIMDDKLPYRVKYFSEEDKAKAWLLL